MFDLLFEIFLKEFKNLKMSDFEVSQFAKRIRNEQKKSHLNRLKNSELSLHKMISRKIGQSTELDCKTSKVQFYTGFTAKIASVAVRYYNQSWSDLFE